MLQLRGEVPFGDDLMFRAVISTSMHTCTHTYGRTYTQVFTHDTYRHVQRCSSRLSARECNLPSFQSAVPRVLAHTNARTHTHTHTHTYTYIWACTLEPTRALKQHYLSDLGRFMYAHTIDLLPVIGHVMNHCFLRLGACMLRHTWIYTVIHK